MKTPRLICGMTLTGILLAGAACAPMLGDAPDYHVRPVQTASATDISPDIGEYQLATQAIMQRDYGLALTHLQAARDMDAHDIKVLNAFGVVYDKLGRFDLSQRYYALAETADPKSEIVARNLAYSKVLRDIQNGASPSLELASLPPLPSTQEIAQSEMRADNWSEAAGPASPPALSPPEALAGSERPPVVAEGLHDTPVTVAQLSQTDLADDTKALVPASGISDLRLSDAGLDGIEQQKLSMPPIDTADMATAVAVAPAGLSASQSETVQTARADALEIAAPGQDIVATAPVATASLQDQDKLEDMPIALESSDAIAHSALQPVPAQPPFSDAQIAQMNIAIAAETPALPPPPPEEANTTVPQTVAAEIVPSAQVTAALPPSPAEESPAALRESPFSAGQAALPGELPEQQIAVAVQASYPSLPSDSLMERTALVTPKDAIAVDAARQESSAQANSSRSDAGAAGTGGDAAPAREIPGRWWLRQFHTAIQWLGGLFDNRDTETREAAAHPIVAAPGRKLAFVTLGPKAKLGTSNRGAAAKKRADLKGVGTLEPGAGIARAGKTDIAQDAVLLLGHSLVVASAPGQLRAAEAIRHSLTERGWSVAPVSVAGVSKSERTAVYYVPSQSAVADALARTLNAPLHEISRNCMCGDLKLVVGNDVAAAKLAGLKFDRLEKLALADHVTARGDR